MLEPVLQFATIIGLFHTFDSIALDRHKALVSGYIFGNGTIKLGAFERGLMLALISPFMIGRRLAWRRVIWLSLVVAVTTNIYVVVLAPSEAQLYVWSGIRYALYLAPFSALLSLPFDWLSLRVSKYIFLDRRPRVYLLVPLILLDATLSSLPTIAQFWLLMTLYPEPIFGSFTHVYLVPAILSAITVNAIASMLITAMQVVALLVGTITRFGVSVLRLTPFLARNSKLSDYPFTTIGGLAALGMQMSKLVF